VNEMVVIHARDLKLLASLLASSFVSCGAFAAKPVDDRRAAPTNYLASHVE